MMMNTRCFALGLATLLSSYSFAYSDVSGFEQTHGYVIREQGGAASVIGDPDSGFYTITASGGSKAAIGIETPIGLQIGALANFRFTSEGPTASGYPYFNFWVSDQEGNHALIALNGLYADGRRHEILPYEMQTSSSGMSREDFFSLQIRAYGSDNSDLSWLNSTAYRGVKYQSDPSALWRSSELGVIDPLTVGDIAHLYFDSPFYGSPNVPGTASPEVWPYAGTGEPQASESAYIVTGSTTGANSGSFQIGDIALRYDAPAAFSAEGGASATAAKVSTGPSGGTVLIGETSGGFFATGETEIGLDGGVTVAEGSTFSTQSLTVANGGELTLDGDAVVIAAEGEIAGTLSLGSEGVLQGGSGTLMISGSVGGSGTLKNLIISGEVSVGNSPGTHHYEGVAFAPGAELLLEIEGAAPEDYDRIFFDGLTDFSGANLTIVFTGGYTPDLSDSFQLFIGGHPLDFASVTTSGGWVLDLDSGIYAIPEPSTLALLLGAGAVGFTLRRRRKG